MGTFSCIVPGRNKPRFLDGDIPWITTPDLEEGRPVAVSRRGLCISREEAKAVGSKIVPPNCVLMSCAGELGIVALTRNEIVKVGIQLTPPTTTGSFLPVWAKTTRGPCWNLRIDLPRTKLVVITSSGFVGRRVLSARAARLARSGRPLVGGWSVAAAGTKPRSLRGRFFRTHASPCVCGSGPCGM